MIILHGILTLTRSAICTRKNGDHLLCARMDLLEDLLKQPWNSDMLLPSFSKTIHDWFYKNGTSSVCSQRHNIPWCVFFLFGIGCLGLHRNKMVFQAEGSNIRLHNECSKKYEGSSGILLSFLSSFSPSQPHKQRF